MEEADCRIVLHIISCLEAGFSTILVETYDTDVFIIVMSYFYFLRSTYGEITIKIRFGSTRIFDVSEACSSFQDALIAGLRFLYAFSGSDITASFYKISNLTIFKTFLTSSTPETVETFAKLSQPSGEIDESDTELIQKFVLEFSSCINV